MGRIPGDAVAGQGVAQGLESNHTHLRRATRRSILYVSSTSDSKASTPGEAQMLWITNSPAPYRVPVWQSIAMQGYSLEVAFVGGSTGIHRWTLDSSVRPGFEAIRGVGATFLASCRAKVVVLGKWEWPLGCMTLLVRRIRKMPTVLFYESTLFTQRHKSGPVSWARRCTFKGVDAVITVGPLSTQAVLAMGVRAEQVVESFNAIDGLALNAQAIATRARPDRSKKPGHVTIYVGQLIRRKNIHTALRAWAEVSGEDDNFIIVGDGPEARSLMELAEEMKISGQVEVRGYQTGNALVESVASAHTLILPSCEEVWGLVVNEALACGLHVVVSANAGVAASIANMPGVYIAKPTTRDLREAIIASREAWQGYISNPEILQLGPERLASDAIYAAKIACYSMIARKRGEGAARSRRRPESKVYESQCNWPTSKNGK